MEKRGVILVPIGVALVLFVGGVAAQPSAVATIMDAEGVAVGEATFTLGPNRSVHVEVTVSGVSSGEHAVHIHTVGLCEGPTFESAGPHFNPHNRKHGRANPEGSHAGDLPNVRVGADGKGQIKVTVTGITLDGLGKESLFKEGGTSLVLHANKDDNMTDPTGNAGPRIACGVIKPFPPVGKATKR